MAQNKDVTACDVQGDGKYVVAAGSLHKSGRRYEVVDDLPIAFIKRAELDAVLLRFAKKDAPRVARTPTARSSALLDMLPLADVMRKLGFDVSRYETNCLMHKSVSGKSFNWNDETQLWYCFGCQRGGNSLTLLRLMGARM